METASFHSLLKTIVKLYPNRVAIYYEERQQILTLTYSELEHLSNQLASYLSKQNLQNALQNSQYIGTRIGVFLPRSPLAIISMLAIFKAGFVYVPLSNDTASFPTKRLLNYAHDSGVQFILTHSQLQRDKFIQQVADKVSTLCLDTEKRWKEEPSSSLNINLPAQSLAYIIYSSGSTGQPKGIAINHQGLANFAVAAVEATGTKCSDIFAQLGDMSFDASLGEIFTALGCGAALYIFPINLDNPNVLYNQFNKAGITQCILTPSLLAKLDPQHFSHLKTVLSVGENLDITTARKWSAGGITLLNGYGVSECTIGSTLGICDPNEGIHVGNPLKNVAVYILQLAEDNMGLVQKQVTYKNKIISAYVALKKDEVGELCIAGISVGRGYWKNTTLTQKHFMQAIYIYSTETKQVIKIKHLYRTHDLAKLNHQSNVVITGRLGRQIKLNDAYLVCPEEVEQYIKQFSKVKNVYVNPYETKQHSIHLIAYVQAKDTLNLRELQLFLLDRLPWNMVPVKWAVVEKLPLLASGKIDANVLLHSKQSITCAPSREKKPIILDSLANVIAQLWSEIIEVNDKYLYSDSEFYLHTNNLLDFELLLARLRESLLKEGYPIEWISALKCEIGEFFRQYKSISDVAAFIKNSHSF